MEAKSKSSIASSLKFSSIVLLFRNEKFLVSFSAVKDLEQKVSQNAYDDLANSIKSRDDIIFAKLCTANCRMSREKSGKVTFLDFICLARSRQYDFIT